MILDLLSKARKSATDIGLIAAQPDVVRAWITLWLTTRDTQVSEIAQRLLTKFIMNSVIAKEVSTIQSTIEDNLMTRRLFRDREIYELMFSYCSLITMGQPGQPDRQQKILSQARLLDFLVDTDHVNSPIRDSQFRDIEETYGVTDPLQGLLNFAFTKMVSLNDDDLTVSTFMNICERYLRNTSPTTNEPSTFALTFLKSNLIHAGCMVYWLKPSPTCAPWLISDSAKYLASYCFYWGDDLLKDQALCRSIKQELCRRFSAASKYDWESGISMRDSLTILMTLPRLLHLETNQNSPLYEVPADMSNEFVFRMLEHVFCEAPAHDEFMQMTARVLYFLYYKGHRSTLWTNMVIVADTVALTSAALMAIHFMGSFVNANWKTLPPDINERVPQLMSEDQLSAIMGSNGSLPKTGLEAMLFEANAARTVLPWILAPARKFNNPLGGWRGDVQVATAKHDLADSILKGMKKMPPSPELQQILEAFDRRVAQGPLGGTSHVGETVATMER